MPKSQDVPKELKEFNAIFNKLAGYRWDASQVFQDFLTMVMFAFAIGETGEMQKERDEAMKRYSEEEKQVFRDMFNCYIKTQHEQTADGGWFDFFGSFYQELSSRSKSSALGQFFTPETLVDVMVRMTPPAPEKKTGNRVADPACGSGRMLLSYHINYPGNFMFGMDIDLICCQMACINMMIHGCVGMVEWKNSLWPDGNHWRTWLINPELYKRGLPGIKPVPKEKYKTHGVGE